MRPYRGREQTDPAPCVVLLLVTVSAPSCYPLASLRTGSARRTRNVRPGGRLAEALRTQDKAALRAACEAATREPGARRGLLRGLLAHGDAAGVELAREVAADAGLPAALAAVCDKGSGRERAEAVRLLALLAPEPEPGREALGRSRRGRRVGRPVRARPVRHRVTPR